MAAASDTAVSIEGIQLSVLDRSGADVVPAGLPDRCVSAARDQAKSELFSRPFVQTATMDHATTMGNIRRFGEHVIPRLREFTPTRYAEAR